MARRTKTIGIRLTSDLEMLLKEQALKRGLKPTSLAQKLVAESLTRSGTPVEEKIAEIQAAIARLERDLPLRFRAAVSAATISPGGAVQQATTLDDWLTDSQDDD